MGEGSRGSRRVRGTQLGWMSRVRCECGVGVDWLGRRERSPCAVGWGGRADSNRGLRPYRWGLSPHTPAWTGASRPCTPQTRSHGLCDSFLAVPCCFLHARAPLESLRPISRALHAFSGLTSTEFFSLHAYTVHAHLPHTSCIFMCGQKPAR